MNRPRCILGGVSPFGRNYCIRNVGHTGPHRDLTYEWDAFSAKSQRMGNKNDGFLRRRVRADRLEDVLGK